VVAFSETGTQVWRRLAEFNGLYVAFLAAFLVLLKGPPRPWLALSTMVLVASDALIWEPVYFKFIPLAPCTSMLFKAGLLWSLGRLTLEAFRHQEELGSATRLGPWVGALQCVAAVLGVSFVGDTRAASPYWAHSTTGECRTSLKSWFAAEKEYFQDHHAYSEDLATIGFYPERGNRYAYFASRRGDVRAPGPSHPLPAGSHTGIQVDVGFKDPPLRAISVNEIPEHLAGGSVLGLVGQCPDHCSITAACAGNLDNHAPLDIWSISTSDRGLPTGEFVPAGIPFHEQDASIGR
jgi:hypothetical protein